MRGVKSRAITSSLIGALLPRRLRIRTGRLSACAAPRVEGLAAVLLAAVFVFARGLATRAADLRVAGLLDGVFLADAFVDVLRAAAFPAAGFTLAFLRVPDFAPRTALAIVV